MQLLRILDSSSAYEIRLTKRQAKIYFDLRIFGTFNGYVLNGDWYFAATTYVSKFGSLYLFNHFLFIKQVNYVVFEFI